MQGGIHPSDPSLLDQWEILYGCSSRSRAVKLPREAEDAYGFLVRLEEAYGTLSIAKG